ncbi:dienelactone hydrolase family protein [Pusillimonas sp.]|uniref:dienelactone hydrolase family protein n=1 Tax=Pusillimonas sp. TaxID=3040095 RepID=UPI0029B43DAC|nr:dienelactone hydrolase family protein [Pusillimonas sp.]MDX3895446.1 dienelactone hydrolase family protein [Pusillimonas sp.]
MANLNAKVSTSNGETVPAYLATAKEGSSAPGLVILQEIFGVNANMRRTADRFAALGYNVLVPDLYWRLGEAIDIDPSDPDAHSRAGGFAQQLDRKAALEDARAAALSLRQQGNGSIKVGAVGYCLGGNFAYQLVTVPGFDAAVSYYGVGIEKVAQGDAVKVPLLMHIAGNDHLCPPNAQQAIHAALDGSPNVTIIEHPGAGHGFARIGGASFHAEAAESADNATIAFLAKHLNGER